MPHGAEQADEGAVAPVVASRVSRFHAGLGHHQLLAQGAFHLFGRVEAGRPGGR